MTKARVPDWGRDRAVRAGRRMVALGLRPTYHLRFDNVAQFSSDPFGLFVWVLELPDVYATAETEAEIPNAARRAISEVLQLPADSFDVEVDPAK